MINVKVLFLLILALSPIACTKEDKAPAKSPEQVVFQYGKPLEFQVGNEEAKAILKSILGHKVESSTNKLKFVDASSLTSVKVIEKNGVEYFIQLLRDGQDKLQSIGLEIHWNPMEQPDSIFQEKAEKFLRKIGLAEENVPMALTEVSFLLKNTSSSDSRSINFPLGKAKVTVLRDLDWKHLIVEMNAQGLIGNKFPPMALD